MFLVRCLLIHYQDFLTRHARMKCWADERAGTLVYPGSQVITYPVGFRLACHHIKV